MPIIPLTCPYCGGDLQIDSNLEAAVCKFCKKPFVVKDAVFQNYINNITNINAENVNIYTQKDFVIEAGELKEYKGESVDVVIPDNVKVIGYRAFMGKGIESVVLSENVVTIGNSAFANCSSLSSVTIPDSVKSIYDYAFYGCSSLKSIIIPDSVETIGDVAFAGCSALKSITIPYGMKAIGVIQTMHDYLYNTNRLGMFSGCSSLESIDIPDSVNTIGDYTFSGCSSLMNVTIPKNVTTIGAEAFKDCSALKSIAIPYGVRTIGKIETGEEYYRTKKRCWGAFQGCSSLTRIVLPDSLVTIGDHSFSSCSSLMSITIPDSVREIGESPFANCSALSSVKCALKWNTKFLGTPFGKQWKQHCIENNLCVFCGTRLPLFGKKCTSCGQYISWIKHILRD